MVNIKEHREKIEETKRLLNGASGKRRHDLQVHLHRLNKQLLECQKYLREKEDGKRKIIVAGTGK